jgi:hypothetical protein
MNSLIIPSVCRQGCRSLNLGQLIGFGLDNGKSATFLLTPSALGDPPNPPALTPEPSSFLSFAAILAFGFACLPACNAPTRDIVGPGPVSRRA